MQPILETQRLILRRPTADEAIEFHKVVNNPLILDMHLGVEYPMTLEEAKGRLGRIPEMIEKEFGYYWCVYLKDNDELVGAVYFTQLDKKHKHVELSYWLDDKHWNKGIMTEAGICVVDWAFQNLDLERIYGMCFTNNPASGRVLENVGMRYEGTSRHEYTKKDQWVDLDHYAILRFDWESDGQTKPLLFETDRLVLRPIVSGDADALENAFNHREIYDITTHMTYPYTNQNARDYIRKTINRTRANDGYNFAVILRKNGELIGEVHLIKFRRKHNTCELGYVFNPEHWKNGYATESCREIIRFAFYDLGIRRLLALTMASNDASRKLLERLGFKCEGILREHIMQRETPVDFAYYGLMKKEWHK
jgi:ribosomal-protein-alanine N-acetyltransferase